MRAKLFDLATFDLEQYMSLDDPSGFDIHQACPKILAFRGPDVRDGRLRTIQEYSKKFKELGVTAGFFSSVRVGAFIFAGACACNVCLPVLVNCVCVHLSFVCAITRCLCVCARVHTSPRECQKRRRVELCR